MRDRPSKEWLDGLKPGDEVVIHDWNNFGDRYAVVRVDRLTKTQIVTGVSKWRRDNGDPVPYSYRCTALSDMPPSEAKAIIWRRNLYSRMKDLVDKHRNGDDFPQLTNEMMAAVIAALTPTTQDE